MTPIESRYDLRLVTLVAVAMEAIENLAMEFNVNPEQLTAEYLFICNKKIHEQGEEGYLNKLFNCYPILDEVID